jgi:hypothetical protein
MRKKEVNKQKMVDIGVSLKYFVIDLHYFDSISTDLSSQANL